MMPLRAKEEFTVSPSHGHVDEDDGVDLGLAPLDPEVVEVRRQMLLADLPAIPEPEPEPVPRPFQFSIKEMMVLTAVFAVTLAILRLVPASVFAGLVALAALVTLPLMGMVPPSARKMWWTALGIYLLSCLVALISGS